MYDVVNITLATFTSPDIAWYRFYARSTFGQDSFLQNLWIWTLVLTKCASAIRLLYLPIEKLLKFKFKIVNEHLFLAIIIIVMWIQTYQTLTFIYYSTNLKGEKQKKNKESKQSSP